MTYQLSVRGSRQLIARIVVVISCLNTSAPVFAQGDLAAAPTRLSLQVTNDTPDGRCRRIATSNPTFVPVSLHRTFHDDFDEHPLSGGKWVSHYAGNVSLPEAFYSGGEVSDLKRKTQSNGRQQIYVGPDYGGRGEVSVRLCPLKSQAGRLAR